MRGLLAAALASIVSSLPPVVELPIVSSRRGESRKSFKRRSRGLTGGHNPAGSKIAKMAAKGQIGVRS